MSESDPVRPAARETVPPDGADAAQPIRAIRLKHPGRIVFAVVLAFLFVKRAGHVWGLDGVVSRMAVVQDHPGLRALVA